MKRLYRIALFVESSRASGRRLIDAVSAFAAMRGDWVLDYQESTLDINLTERIQGWQGDGIITRITSDDQAAALSQSGVPTLDLLGAKKYPGISSISTDNNAVAELATSMFMRKGYVEFAFCGYSGVYFSDARQQAFENMAQLLGIPCLSYQNLDSQSSVVWESESWHLSREKHLTDWLLHLPKPAAIFACNDTQALQISSACRLAGIKVPEQCLILGVDNDAVICEMSAPAISSIEPDYAKQGKRGAEMLQEMMDTGSAFLPFSEVIAPKTVVERSSTDSIVFKTPFVAEAVRLIGNHAYRDMDVVQIAAAVGVSRSQLDRGFMTEIGYPVSKEIVRVRLNHIQYLLRYSSITLQKIATETGFSCSSSLSRFYKSETGESPNSYRTSHSS